MKYPGAAAVILVLLALAGSAAPAQEQDFESILRFEGGGATLIGWGGGPAETMHFDSMIVHGGRGAVRLERESGCSGTFSALTKKLPIDFDGKWLELRGFLRSEGVAGFAGLWMREDGPNGMLQFDNMQSRGVHGTTG